MLKKEVLYIGMDESNHGETKPRIGEIIVASYSYDSFFWEEKKHPNRRNYARVVECMENDFNYVFTIVPHGMAKINYSNLSNVAPFLIKEIISDKDKPDKVKLGLDGELKRKDRRGFLEKIAEQDLDVTLKNFVKRKGVHQCPELIYLSHQIANNLLNKSPLVEIARNLHYIPLNFD
ncbi:MAG: hypothetical protein WDZ69_03385 [Candidatus Pacearchaeota archaeon]